MSPSLLPIVPALSRSFKYQEHARNKCHSSRPIRQSKCHTEEDTKNQENHQISSIEGPSERCFEVRPSTNGVGMFAIKEISIGDIIIDSEEPIVSTSLSLFPPKTWPIADPLANRYAEKANGGNKAPTRIIRQDEDDTVDPHEEASYERRILQPPFCQTCGTPIGNLRQDHMKAPLHLELPGIEKGDVGLVFTLDKSANARALKRIDSKLPEQDENTPRSQTLHSLSPYSHHTAWCSDSCWEQGSNLHEWLCWNREHSRSQESRKRLKTSDETTQNVEILQKGSNTTNDLRSESSRRLQTFLEARDNPKIYELAIHAILLVLPLISKENPRRIADNDAQNHQDSPLSTRYNYFWWEDYGSHPLWWTIGAKDNRKERFQRAQEFADILRDWSKDRVLWMKQEDKEGFDGEGKGHRLGNRKQRRSQLERTIVSNEAKIPNQKSSEDHCDIDTLFSVNNIGALLGMLQCNVMEFSYPSPLEQYMEQAEEFMDEEHLASIQSANDHDEGDETDPVDTMRDIVFVRGCRWLREKYWSAPKEDPQSNPAVPNHHEASSQDHMEHSSFASPGPVVGSGLYPLLTLANHHCNPNASIEFLRESNLGSMVALRPIKTGEEICITYVPNGGGSEQLESKSYDGNDGDEETTINAEAETGNKPCGGYFQHFEPTRTWKWLNSNQDDGSESDEKGCDSVDSQSHQDDTKSEDLGESTKDLEDQSLDPFRGDENSDDNQTSGPTGMEDGANPKHRALALLEYGFKCMCKRCDHKKVHHQDPK